jgi:hypothetical protein
VLWYALKCEDYFNNYCCESDCSQAPDRIEFCIGYLISLGIPDPPDIATKCYYIKYDCCIYVLIGTEALPCPNPLSIWPVNEGELVKVKNRVLGENPCCYPDPQEQGNPGGIADLETEQGPVIENDPQLPCEELIAECYTFQDQVGTVKGNSITISSTATTCIETIGVPWEVRCDHGPPEEIKSISKSMTQDIDFCTVLDPSTPTSCPTQVTQVNIEFMTCPDCEPEGDCCGVTPICDDFPEYCESFEDRYETYNVQTCYSLGGFGCAPHVVDIMTIVFPACFAPGIDPEDPGAQEALNALFLGSSGIVHVSAEDVNTGWGILPAIKLSVCGLDVVTFSGNAAHMAQRINNRLGGLVSASGIAPWSAFFWFGNRQSCVACDWQTPNDRPGFSAGDALSVDRVAFTNSNTEITVTLVASSPRYYACAAQTLVINYFWAMTQSTCNAGISATSASPNNYGIQCLSFPEYAFGSRYTMKPIQQYASPDISICTDIAFFQNVTDCEASDGWPLEDITVDIGGTIIVLVYGWSSLCPGMPDARTGCYAYPYIYEPAPCCPQGEDCSPGGAWETAHPLPQPCLRSFQSSRSYCKSSGSIITIT